MCPSRGRCRMYPPCPPSLLFPSCGRRHVGGIPPTGSRLPPLFRKTMIKTVKRWNPLPTLNWAVFVGLLQAARPSTTKNKAIVRSFYFLFTTIIFLPCLTDETEEANYVTMFERGTNLPSAFSNSGRATCLRPAASAT